LLGAVLKYTDDDNPDKKDLEEAIKIIKAFLTKVNEESGKSENIFELAQLEGQLVFRPSEHIVRWNLHCNELNLTSRISDYATRAESWLTRAH
jgi:hypothetical protein